MRPKQTCDQCHRHKLELDRQRVENDSLRARIAELEAALALSKKNSRTSSKPPSSDMVKPAKSAEAKGEKRRRGGQPGHARQERELFTPDQIDVNRLYTLSECPKCGGHLDPLKTPPRIVQQVEMAPAPIVVTEHRGLPYFCSHCQKIHYAPIPAEVRAAGLMGPRLTAVVAFLKGGCHCSFSTIRKFLRDVLGFTVSRSYLRNICAKVSDSLDGAYAELLDLLPKQGVLNIDETGHKEYARSMWTWVFRSATFTLFKIDPRRSSEVLIEVLGREFAGVLGCDYFSAYRKYMREFGVLVQFCLAHLLRDIRFLAEHPNSQNRAYGKRLAECMRQMFHVIHHREEYSSEHAFQIALENAAEELDAQAVWHVPNTKEARNLAKRFRKHGQSYLRFITTPGIDPTNNLAEQAIRFVVIDRLVTQGSRSEAGRNWLERIWTVMATCAQTGESAFAFLAETIAAYFAGEPTPSLVPNTS